MYGTFGAHMKDLQTLYLMDANGEFPYTYGFINPTFKPQEKKVFVLGYGSPGTVGLYKYQWKGCTLDTVEAIYPDLSDTLHKCYKRYRNHKEERIYVVPKEYRDTDYFWWFEGKDYDDI
jgi:hypothetical protein